MHSEELHNKGIILFDGVCNLCNAGVNFIMKRDVSDYFRFGSLQSEEGKRLLSEYNYKEKKLDSIILIENKKVYTHSKAALQIAKRLEGLWKILYLFVVLPTFIRDFLYKIIADNRYKLFGKKEYCRLPTSSERSKFI